MRKNILLLGTGGHAKVVLDILSMQAAYNIIGVVHKNSCVGQDYNGAPILGGYDDLCEILRSRDIQGGIVAKEGNTRRASVVAFIEQEFPDFEFINAIHPGAHVSDRARLGCGVAIMAGTVINADAYVDDHCVFNTNCTVDHDCKIWRYAYLAPGCGMGGYAMAGEFSFIGMGATILHGRIVGKHAVVGAGAMVNKNVADYSVSFGVPARHHRFRDANEPYL